MDDFTPSHHLAHPDPSGPPAVTAGPAVPVTVWRIRSAGTDMWRSLGTRLAARLVATYSRPGEAVVDLTGDHALSAACTGGRRRHVPAWFSDTTGLTLMTAATADTSPQEPAADEAPPDAGAWFGDDLTDLSPGSGGRRNRPPGPAAPTTLVVVPAGAGSRQRLPELIAGCAALLTPGGCLLVITHRRPPEPAGGDATAITGAAYRAGLRHLQRIAVLSAGSGQEVFTYPGDEELLAIANDNDAVVDNLTGIDVLVYA